MESNKVSEQDSEHFRRQIFSTLQEIFFLNITLLFWEQTLEVNRLVEILDFKNSVNVWIIFKPVNFGDND